MTIEVKLHGALKSIGVGGIQRGGDNELETCNDELKQLEAIGTPDAIEAFKKKTKKCEKLKKKSDKKLVASNLGYVGSKKMWIKDNIGIIVAVITVFTVTLIIAPKGALLKYLPLTLIIMVIIILHLKGVITL